MVGKFLYYAREIDPIIFVALNSLATVQKNLTTETAKQTNQFLNYSPTHLYAVTEHRRSGMILHIYLDASYI